MNHNFDLIEQSQKEATTEKERKLLDFKNKIFIPRWIKSRIK